MFIQNLYHQNLKVTGNSIYSYSTHVAEIDHVNKEVTALGYWSSTTSKHINYVAKQLGYQVVKAF